MPIPHPRPTGLPTCAPTPSEVIARSRHTEPTQASFSSPGPQPADRPGGSFRSTFPHAANALPSATLPRPTLRGRKAQ